MYGKVIYLNCRENFKPEFVRGRVENYNDHVSLVLKTPWKTRAACGRILCQKTTTNKKTIKK